MSGQRRQGLVWYGFWVLVVMTSLVACGSRKGGGGDGDGGQRAPAFPNSVTYSIGGGGVIFETDSATFGVGIGLQGIYRKTSRNYTLPASPVPRFEVRPMTPAGDPPWAVFVVEALQFDYGNPPTIGTLRVGVGNYVDVRVTNNAGGSGQPGVNLELWEFGQLVVSSSFRWADFEVLKDSPTAEAYQIRASTAYHMVQMVFDHVQTLMDQYEYLTLNDMALQSAGSGAGLTYPCDVYLPTSTTGSAQAVWLDGPGGQSGELGPADNFLFTYADCYKDRRREAPGRLYTSGGVRWNNYLEGSSPLLLGSTDTRFESLRSTATTVNAAGDIVPGESVLTTSFGLINNQPDQPDPSIGFAVFLTPDTSTPINTSNAIQVAGVGVSSLQLPRQIGALALDLTISVLQGAPIDFCNSGGGYSVNVSPPSSLVAGQDVTITFTNCISTFLDPDAVTVTGSLGFEVENVSGNPTGTNYALEIALGPINVNTTTTLGTTALSGAMRFSRTAVGGNFTEVSQSVAGTPLRVAESEGGTTVTRDLSAFSINSSLATNDVYTVGAPGNAMLISASNLSGALTLEMLAAIQGTEPNPPTSGSFRMTAGGNSLTLTVGAGGAVTLAVDDNGDGTIDATIPTTWDALD